MSPALVLTLVTVLWGSTFIVTKDLIAQNPPLGYLTLRFAIGALSLALLCFRKLRSLDRATVVDGLIVAALNALGLFLQVVGQVYTTASKSSFITSLSVPLTPLCAMLLYRARPTRAQIVAIVCASIGLGLLSYPGAALRFNPGDLCTFACALTFGFTIVEMSRRSRGKNALLFATTQVAWGTLIYALAWMVAQRLAPIWHTPVLMLEARPLLFSPRFVTELLYMGVVCTAITSAGQMWAMARMSATGAAIVFALEPVFATLMALALWGASEWPGPRGLTGIAFVLSAVAIAQIRLAGDSKVGVG